MGFDLSLFEFSVTSRQWWIRILGISCGNFDGALLHIEKDNGYWKFDIFYLRHLFTHCL